MEIDGDTRDVGAETDGSAGGGSAEIPLGQRFFDRPFLLLALGMLVMVLFFTLWGLWEINSLPIAPLP